MDDALRKWIDSNGLADVECIVPDMNGVARGKVWPAHKFADLAGSGGLRIPSSILAVSVTGRYAVDKERDPGAISDPDMTLRPDARTVGLLRADSATGFVFADACGSDGAVIERAPRQVLQRTLRLFDEMGWQMLAAPELEFYLTGISADPNVPLTAPAGRSQRAETSAQPYGLEASDEYRDLIEAIYARAEAASIRLGTRIHESGSAQFEINFHHGDPVLVSDQVVIFKRIVREVALAHGMHATFMAKPMANQPSSSMHVHASAVDMRSGRNLFTERGGISAAFRHFVAGLQRFLPEVAPLYAPNVNSFRRMRPTYNAPTNVYWGRDNRSCGLRVPASDAENTRIENRLPGADANPYLAIAATLCCGLLGLRGRLEPTPPVEGNAYLQPPNLPRSLEEALDRFDGCREVIELLGEPFVRAYRIVKTAELNAYQDVITPWEREHLQLKI